MKSIICEKSLAFAINVVNTVSQIQNKKREYILTKQLIKSGISIGANAYEAQGTISKADFSAKIAISHKEALETKYWLLLLKKTNYITEREFDRLFKDCDELIAILYSIVKKCRF